MHKHLCAPPDSVKMIFLFVYIKVFLCLGYFYLVAGTIYPTPKTKEGQIYLAHSFCRFQMIISWLQSRGGRQHFKQQKIAKHQDQMQRRASLFSFFTSINFLRGNRWFVSLLLCNLLCLVLMEHYELYIITYYYW